MIALAIHKLDAGEAAAFRAQPHNVYAADNADEVLVSRHHGGDTAISASASTVGKLRVVRVGDINGPVQAVVREAVEVILGSKHGSDESFVLVTLANHAAVLITTATQEGAA